MIKEYQNKAYQELTKRHTNLDCKTTQTKPWKSQLNTRNSTAPNRTSNHLSAPPKTAQ